jgi:hypothetical protein
MFVYLLPFKSYSKFSFWLEITIGAAIWRVWGYFRPLNQAQRFGTARRPQNASSFVKPRRLNHHTFFVRRSNKNISKGKRSQSVCFRCVQGLPHSNGGDGLLQSQTL